VSCFSVMNVEQNVFDFADNGASPEKNMIPDAVENAARAGLTLGENRGVRSLWMHNELLKKQAMSQRVTVPHLGQECRRIVELLAEPFQAFDGETKSILFKREPGGLRIRIPRNMPPGNANSSCIFVCLACYIRETYGRVCVPWSFSMTRGPTHVYMYRHSYREKQKPYGKGTHTCICLVYISSQKNEASGRDRHT
jgi:hypothetical protein